MGGQKKAKIEVFYLPPYSPELNPDEYLNNDLKNPVDGKKSGILRAKDTIRKKTISHWRHFLKSPRKVVKLFNYPKFRYAKASEF